VKAMGVSDKVDSSSGRHFEQAAPEDFLVVEAAGRLRRQ